MDHPVYQNFRNLLLKAAQSRPNAPLTEERRIAIETRLQEMWPAIQAQPDHPTYHWMILDSIRNLNGGMGSSEMAISNYMKKKFKNLPWAHSTFLTNYLSKLCESGEILINQDKLYTEPKDADNKSISLKNQPKKCGKRCRPPKNSAVDKVRKLEQDERMDVLEVKKPHCQPITRRYGIVNSKSDTTDVGMLCSHLKPKPLEHEELMVVALPKIKEGKELSPLVQLGRGQRSKRKTTRFLSNLDQKKLENPTTRPHGRPPSCKHLADENEPLQLVGDTKSHKESDVGTRTDRFKPLMWYHRRSKRSPRCKLMDNGEPQGIIIASPAPAAQVKQKGPRKGSIPPPAQTALVKKKARKKGRVRV